MNDITRAQINLLKELDEICLKNDLKYTLTGEPLANVIENGCLPDEINYLTVAMTEGDIERLTNIVNDNIEGRFVETFLTNSNGRKFENRFCNSETTRIDITNYKYHVNHGIFIRIAEAVAIPDKKPVKYHKLSDIWKRSYMKDRPQSRKKRLEINSMRMAQKTFGRKYVAKKIYDYRRQFYHVDKWENLQDNMFVRIGRETMRANILEDLIRIETPVGQFYTCSTLMDKIIVRERSSQTMNMEEIIDAETPYREMMHGKFMEHLEKAFEAREEFHQINDKSLQARKTIDNNWNIYLMSRDVVELREIYDESKVNRLQALLDSNNVQDFDLEVSQYEETKINWTKKKVPFVAIDAVDKLIEYRNQL